MVGPQMSPGDRGAAPSRGEAAVERPAVGGHGGPVRFLDIVPDLKAKLPNLRGRLIANEPLGPLTWFRVGGPAQALFIPHDDADLAYLLSVLPAEIPVFVLGLGSNLIVRDGGVPGVVIRLGRGFNEVTIGSQCQLEAGAGVPDLKVALAAQQAGLAGLAFLRGIPGAVGGALRMNAGAYGREIKDVLVAAHGVDRRGRARVFSAAEMDFGYRHCGLSEDVVLTRAVLKAVAGEQQQIAAEMQAITQARAATQPVKSRTGGSTFKNPPGAKAWELIDRAGCRGLRLGQAEVSELHCNFLINRGEASAHEIESLGELVRTRVRERCGVDLQWEIKRIGLANSP
jgi:UDP-N-acetylmuramate dehydrogenase